MSTLSKLNSGVKSLVAVTTNQQQVALLNENKSNDHGLKLWQLGLLVGVPSALLAFYFIYYRNNNNKNKKNINDKSKSNAKIDKKTNNEDSNKEKKPVDKKVDSSNLTPEERIKNILDSIQNQKNETLLEKAVQIKNIGNEYFQAGKFENAVKCYSEAIKLCPSIDKDELPKFYQNRAAAYENLKLYQNVIEDCTSALQVDPSYTKALARRAKAYESIDKLQEAFEDHTALCILQKFTGSSMASADRIVKKTRECIPISQHFVNNFYIGLNNDIIFKNQQFYDIVKESNSTSMLNAMIAFNDGDYVKCIENCNEVIESNNEFKLEALNLRGSLYMLRCQYIQAKEDFALILNSEQASVRIKSNTYIKLTALNLQNGEEEQAFENYEKAIEIDAMNEDIYCNRAQVYAMKGRFEECFRDFEKCIALNNDHKIAKLQKAFFEFRQFYAQLTMLNNQQTSLNESKELRDETNKLEKLLEQYSNVPEAYNLYAQILSEQENYEKAERFYKMAMENDPKNAALLVQRALNIMTWKNDFNEPIEMLNEAIQIDSTCEFAYETLATIEIQRGNLNRAVELFQHAINLTRSEDSLTNLCCMLVGAKTQFKILQQYRSADSFEY